MHDPRTEMPTTPSVGARRLVGDAEAELRPRPNWLGVACLRLACLSWHHSGVRASDSLQLLPAASTQAARVLADWTEPTLLSWQRAAYRSLDKLESVRASCRESTKAGF